MDNNDSMKPQQTGGLKLMTVFIAVLALHVLVIGGFTVYHLMNSGGSDADLTLDKNHKLKADGTQVADAGATDAASTDKSTDAAAPATTDTASTTGTTTPATTDTAGTTPAAPPATATANPPATPTTPAAAPATTPTAPAPTSGSQVAQATPAIAPGLLPPPEPGTSAATVTPAPLVVGSTPTTPATLAPLAVPPIETAPEISGPIMAPGSVTTGPVHMPAVAPKPSHSSEEHVASASHETRKEIYTVKITDSYKKIAHAHHITVAELKEANHIHDNVLHMGQRLIIPGGKTFVAKNEPEPEVGTPSRVVLNDMSSLSASPSSSATEHHHHYYTVAKGDTLKKIAKKFDTTTLAIKEANDLSGSKLTVGKKLKIPSKETRSAGISAPSPMQPSQVETQPAPIAPVAQPAPVEPPAPQPTPATSPELANLTF